MIIIYDTRSNAEARTLEALRVLLLGTLLIILWIYSGHSFSTVLGMIVLIVYLGIVAFQLLALVLQFQRERIHLATLKVDISKRKIKYFSFPWAIRFKSIKLFHVNDAGVEIEFVKGIKLHTIWQGLVDENPELYGDFIAALRETSTESSVSLKEFNIPKIRRKSHIYTMAFYTVVFILTMFAFSQLFHYLLDQKTLLVLFFAIGITLTTIITRLVLYIKFNQFIKKNKTQK